MVTPEGNERLTALTGAALLVLIVAAHVIAVNVCELIDEAIAAVLVRASAIAPVTWSKVTRSVPFLCWAPAGSRAGRRRRQGIAAVSTSATPISRRESIEMITNGRKIPVRLTRRGTAAALAAALVGATLAVAGCGSSSSASSPATTAAGVNATSTGSAKLEQFAQCMRAHGVTDFPDPTAEGSFNLPTGMTGSPQFASADQSCKSLAPAGVLSGRAPTTEQLNQTVKFVNCMRKHGEPGFPDPLPNGTFQLNGGPSPVDPNAPQFKTAMTACHSLLPPGSGFGTGH